MSHTQCECPKKSNHAFHLSAGLLHLPAGPSAPQSRHCHTSRRERERGGGGGASAPDVTTKTRQTQPQKQIASKWPVVFSRTVPLQGTEEFKTCSLWGPGTERLQKKLVTAGWFSPCACLRFQQRTEKMLTSGHSFAEPRHSESRASTLQLVSRKSALSRCSSFAQDHATRETQLGSQTALVSLRTWVEMLVMSVSCLACSIAKPCGTNERLIASHSPEARDSQRSAIPFSSASAVSSGQTRNHPRHPRDSRKPTPRRNGKSNTKSQQLTTGLILKAEVRKSPQGRSLRRRKPIFLALTDKGHDSATPSIAICLGSPRVTSRSLIMNEQHPSRTITVT